MGYGLGELEDALLERIRQELPYLQHCDSYAGEAKVVQDELIITGVNFPAVLVMMQEEAGEPQSKSSYEMRPTFRLLVCARNLRGQRAARREPFGAYQILDDLKKTLIDQKLGLNIEPVKYLKTQSISISQEQVIYAVEYQITCYWP